MANLLSQDHYTYLNNLLNLKENNRLSAEKKLRDEERLALIARIEAELKRLNAAIPPNEEQLKKTRLALDLLKDNQKRALYNQGLLSQAKQTVQLAVGNETLGQNVLIPLVSMDKIIAVFEALKNDPRYSALKDQFTYTITEGNPTIYTFYFPTHEAGLEFVNQLFDNNLAMLPNGSQNIHDLPQPTPTSEHKEKHSQEAAVVPTRTHQMREHLHQTRKSTPETPPHEPHAEHHESPKGRHHRK